MAEFENLDDPILDHIHDSFSSISAADTVGHTLEELRTRVIPQGISYFYALDAGKLVGVVPTRTLLTAPLASPIASIMIKRVVALPSTAKVVDACELFLLHKYLALPVVDGEGRLLGIIDIGLFTDTMVEAAEKQEADNVFQLIGVHIAHGREGTPWSSFRERFPWLLCNLAGGIACAMIAGMHEALLQHQIVIALFMPVVLALAESVSIQSLSITLKSLDVPSIGRRLLPRALRKELAIAIMLGLASGTVVAGIVTLWRNDVTAALAIGASIAGSVVTACLLGVLMPTVVHLLGRDPKIAAGPIVLALADTATFLFYFNLAGLLLG